ncbi:hypothetical protein MLD38_007338 [Melastoma candidum]|uniref:Uncharacterized protein n=1 Tax=Melastoma candidum TaxID=119954 RepID=A0ACB9RTT9_9MYRT|nr:hypothetical protein MLD38_007338 [Melastoma candidum]
MEKLVRSYDKERMKLAMLKHEQTFKEQVYELHRLYRIQKTLMKALKGERGDGRRHPFMGREDSCHDDDGIELTLGLGPTGYNTRTRKRCGGTSPSLSSSTTTGSSGQEKSGASYGCEGKGGHGGGVGGRNRLRVKEQQHPPWFIQAVLSMNQDSL